MGSPPSLRRRWPDTLAFAVLGLPLLVWGVAILSEGGWYGVLVSLLGVLFVGGAILGPADGPCPLCGQTLHDFYMLLRRGNHRCAHCKRYFRFEDGEGKELPEDFIAPEPLFPVPIGPGNRLPELCCICGGEASRTEELRHRVAGRQSQASPIMQVFEITVTVPYCEQHSGTVRITSENLAPSRPFFSGMATGDETDYQVVLKVPSYRFYRSASSHGAVDHHV